MNIGILTSSRADFGIYTPLLKELSKEHWCKIEIIAFGTHLSEKHGYTLSEIKSTGLKQIKELKTPVVDGSAKEISLAYGQTEEIFAEYWDQNEYNLVLCLGDRYEMSAAVQAGIPFGVRFAHFHGGETTLGAIDNTYRHQITLASEYHFPATDNFANRIEALTGQRENIFSVGSMSLSDINEVNIPTREELNNKFNIDAGPFILATFHPETVDYKGNSSAVNVILDSLEKISSTYQIVISMPNADTNGKVLREAFIAYAGDNNKITLVESFGKENYFGAMTYADLMIGNSSSGIIEAASFGLRVVNIGDRQKGRVQSGNVVNAPYDKEKICTAISTLVRQGKFDGENEYTKENTISLITAELKKIGNE